MYYDPHALIEELEKNLGALKDKVAAIESCNNVNELGKIETFARENIQALLVHGANISKGVKSAVDVRRDYLRRTLNSTAMDRVRKVLGEKK